MNWSGAGKNALVGPGEFAHAGGIPVEPLPRHDAQDVAVCFAVACRLQSKGA
jgi:hypothetical protein